MNSNAKTYHLTDRAILALKGADAKELLQGTITQDINLLDTQPLLYAAHLSPQGKALYDFFIYTVDGTYYLDVHKPQLLDIAKALHKYCVGLKVDFDDLTDEVNIYATNQETPWPDPRLPDLGYRNYTPNTQKQAEPVESYHAKRINLGVPDIALDAPFGKTLPAELGLEDLNGVSFTKGCYVGQEVTARMHHKTTPKKRLYQTRVTSPLPPFTEIKTDTDSKAGWLGTMDLKTQTGLCIISTRFKDATLTAEGSPIQIL